MRVGSRTPGRALREVLPDLGIDGAWRAFPLENVHELFGVPLRHEMYERSTVPRRMMVAITVEGQERVLQRRWLDIPDIDPGPGDLPGFQAALPRLPPQRCHRGPW